jgi:acylphosphatase
MPAAPTTRVRRHLTIRVTGKVQGVAFRQAIKNMAEGLGLTGYARNNEDGSVTMELEGEESAIEDILRWSWVGPANARVLNVEVEPGSLQHYTAFSTE